MGCLACGTWGSPPLCAPCRSLLHPARPRRLECGLLVLAPLAHEGPARRLVHRLKYEAVGSVVPVLAALMAPLVPPATRLLVPVPRVTWRRLRYGIDPGDALARALGRRTGLPVGSLLVPRLIGPVHAGRSRSDRRPPIFSARRRAIPGALLVDDVVTTGGTLAAAAAALGTPVSAALTATAVPG